MMAHLPRYETLDGRRFGFHSGPRGMTFTIDDRKVSEGEYMREHAEAFAKEFSARLTIPGERPMTPNHEALIAEAEALAEGMKLLKETGEKGADGPWAETDCENMLRNSSKVFGFGANTILRLTAALHVVLADRAAMAAEQVRLDEIISAQREALGRYAAAAKFHNDIDLLRASRAVLRATQEPK